jgi:2-keto-3-deoxy-L-rhamnonate aldolase RhmA
MGIRAARAIEKQEHELDRKGIILKGVPAVGWWIGIADPSGVEVVPNAGFDWLLINMEHSPNGEAVKK